MAQKPYNPVKSEEKMLW